MDSNENAVLKTVVYADVFRAPLKISHLERLIITPTSIEKTAIDAAIHRLLHQKKLGEQNGYLYLPERKDIVLKKVVEKKYIHKKIDIAQKAVKVISQLHTVLFIGLSGGLASGLATESEDIDFFIIAKDRTLWTTRLWSMFLLEKNGIRRKRTDTVGSDKICLNMFVSDTRIEFDKSRHDIYTAYELAQMRPLFSRNNTYSLLLRKNRWIHRFLANFKPLHPDKEIKSIGKNDYLSSTPVIQFAKLLQILIMRYHKTSEIVTDDFFAFHPRDYRTVVLSEFKKRLKTFSLL